MVRQVDNITLRYLVMCQRGKVLLKFSGTVPIGQHDDPVHCSPHDFRANRQKRLGNVPLETGCVVTAANVKREPNVRNETSKRKVNYLLPFSTIVWLIVMLYIRLN